MSTGRSTRSATLGATHHSQRRISDAGQKHLDEQYRAWYVRQVTGGATGDNESEVNEVNHKVLSDQYTPVLSPEAHGEHSSRLFDDLDTMKTMRNRFSAPSHSLWSVKQASEAMDVSRQSIRSYTKAYTKFFSTKAMPEHRDERLVMA